MKKIKLKAIKPAKMSEDELRKIEGERLEWFTNRIAVGKARAKELFDLLTDEKYMMLGRDKKLEEMVEYTTDSVTLITLMNLAVVLKGKEGKQMAAKMKAAQNAPAREYAREKWVTCRLEKPKFPKCKFAMICADEIKAKFKINVASLTIERTWLPVKKRN